MAQKQFEIGSRYENRRGEFEVLSIDGTSMEIRYEDGETMETPVRMQRRILDNMALEEQIQEQKEKQRRRKRRKKSSRYGREFEGLEEDDFQEGVIGTSWRSRPNLGGLLARHMTEMSGRAFESRAVPRQPSVYVVQPDPFNKEIPDHKARYVFTVDEQNAYYGFFIERHRDEMDHTWDWPEFLQAMRDDEDLHGTLENMMERYGLKWELTVVDEDGEAIESAQVERRSDGLVLLRPNMDEQPIDWLVLSALLEQMAPENDLQVYLRGRFDKEEALNMGLQVAVEAAKAWNGLLPLYLASVRN